jgi:hypothetical protein
LDISKILIWSGTALSLALFILTVMGIIKGIIRQSAATFLLWALLDTIALVSVILQKGNYILLVFFTMSGFMTFGCLLYKRLFIWTSFETKVAALVAVCLVVWAMSGPMWATVASTIAVFISGFPQMRDSWRHPDLKTGLIYVGFTAVNLSSFFAGKDWSIKERFYYGVCSVLVIIIALVSLLRKKPAIA